MKPSAYIYLVLKLRMDAAIPPLPHAFIVCTGQLYIYVQMEWVFYAYIFFLIKAAHTVLGWN
jgi:hypothetical protein